jgi:ribonuclease R
VLIEVLGADDRPEWDDRAVMSQFGLRHRFGADVMREAEAFAEPGSRERRGRVDRRHLLSFTIDPEDARDHDDALSVEPLDGGRFEVGVHIADVSHYVTPGSALDREAEARGTSTYLPAEVVPMLPPRLSGDLCSLRPDRDRLALSVMIELDAEGRAHHARFEETVIKSRHRLDYGQVQEIIAGQRRVEPDLETAIGLLLRLSRALRARRRARGALELDVPEVKAWVDERGAPIRIERREHLESHELIEEFMLLANECVGAEGTRREAGLLYRVHEPPAAGRLAELDVMLKALGLPRPGNLTDPARALQALLAVRLDPPHRRLLHRLVLRALSRARYLERDLGHFGLATREYCHFTSPIRRYPDLHNHRRVREWIRGHRTASWDPVELATRAERCTAAEQNATDAEREAIRAKAMRFLEGRLGERASGIITALKPQGFFVELDEIPVEGFVRVSLYADDHFVLDSSGVRMVGRRTRRRFVLGDPVQVVIARVDVVARECDLALEVSPRRSRRQRHGRS